MFAPFMWHAWFAGTVVAVLAGAIGFFVILRGSAFPAHAIPNGAFAGAAGANLVGANPLVGLVVFALAAALGIGVSGRRVRHDVATALALVLMLALGSAFLAVGSAYEPAVNALLFGQILGVASSQLGVVVVLALASLVALALLYRPLLFASVSPELARARGVRVTLLDVTFLAVLAVASALVVPVVGALLSFSLMIGPPAAARVVSSRPARTLVLGVVLALATVWGAIAASFVTNLPIGFFVGTFGSALYLVARLGAAVFARRRRPTAA